MRAKASCVAILVAAALGCSGRYEVGEADGARAGSSGATSDAHGSRSSIDDGGSLAGGGSAGSGVTVGGGSNTTPDGSDDEFGPSCVPLGEPFSIAGDLVAPRVLWERVAPFIWGEAAEPPTELPETTTYEWAAQVVTQAFARVPEGNAPGVQLFIEKWVFEFSTISTTPEVPLTGEWTTRLAGNAPALERLLVTPIGEHRYGLFSEQRFLAKWMTPTGRGMRISNALLNQLPTPPTDEAQPSPPVAGRTHRQVLEEAVVSGGCAGCHRYLDPLGFAFEHFDMLGSYRTLDNGLPIDASASFQLKRRLVSFDGPLELGRALVDSCDGQVGLADGFLRVALRLNGVSEEALPARFEEDRERVEQLFVHSENRSYADLVRAFAQTRFALVYR